MFLVVTFLSSIIYSSTSWLLSSRTAVFESNDTPGTVVKKLCINTEKKGNKKFDMEGL